MPYNPGIQNRWGELLAQGVSKAGDAFAGQIEKHESDAKKAKGLRTYLGEIEPDVKAKFDAMGLNELEGYGQALAGKQQRASQAAAMAKEAAQTQLATQQLSTLKANADYEAKQRDARAKFMGELSGLETITPEKYIGAAARSGYELSGHDIPSFINSYAREKREADRMTGALKPYEYKADDGTQFTVLGNQILPHRAGATKPGLGAPVTLPNGGTGYFNGSTVVPLKSAPDLTHFDSKDGKLTRKGFNDAVMSGFKGVYEGMPVNGQPGPVAPAGGGLFDQFLASPYGKGYRTNQPPAAAAAGAAGAAAGDGAWGAGVSAFPVMQQNTRTVVVPRQPTGTIDDYQSPEDVWVNQ